VNVAKASRMVANILMNFSKFHILCAAWLKAVDMVAVWLRYSSCV